MNKFLNCSQSILTETLLIIPDITKTESNNCFIINCFEINSKKINTPSHWTNCLRMAKSRFRGLERGVAAPFHRTPSAISAKNLDPPETHKPLFFLSRFTLLFWNSTTGPNWFNVLLLLSKRIIKGISWSPNGHKNSKNKTGQVSQGLGGLCIWKGSGCSSSRLRV